MIQTLIDAISNGGLYGLAALGIGLVFGVLRLINFAYGELIAIAAYVLVLAIPLGIVPGLLLALAASAALALLMELSVFRRLRGADAAVMLVASFGVSVALQRIYELGFGALPKSGQVVPWMSGRIEIGDVSVSRGSAVTMVLTLGLLLLMKIIVERTTFGLQIQAASIDFQMARLLGVRVNRIIAAAFVCSGLLAAVVGFLVVVQRAQVEPRFGVSITILALVGTVIGGLGRLESAALGGFLVGATLSILNATLGSARVYSYSILFVLVIVVLLWRPAGIFGSATSGERV